ncbi:MAG: ABC transporter permease [Candidatus Promineifilaceae bacterium]|nr:ABC transporter permease [Candidatus Promineifilaceae bacterium]
MINNLRLLWAFLVRDFYTEISYRTAFLVGIGGIFFNVLIFFFLSKFVDAAANPMMAETGGDYFSFVLIGVAFGSYFGAGMTSFARGLRLAQTTGTLEAMMMTPSPVPAIIIGSASWSYVFTTFRVLVYLLIGTLVLGVSFSGANYAAALLGLLLAIISFASIGIISAGIIMIIKRGDAVTGLISGMANLVGGVFYPIAILPPALQFVARLLPITYALRLMRKALLGGATWSQLASDFLALIIFCVILFPLSLVVFRYAVHRARLEGTLAHY